MKKRTFLLIVAAVLLSSVIYVGCKKIDFTSQLIQTVPSNKTGSFSSTSKTLADVLFMSDIKKKELLVVEENPRSHTKRSLFKIYGLHDPQSFNKYVLFEQDSNGEIVGGRYIISIKRELDMQNLFALDLSDKTVFYG
jgi:hypothetical protein